MTKKIELDVAPEGYEYKLVEKAKTKEEKLEEIKDKLTEELANTSEPTIEELIEIGKDIHPYYKIKKELDGFDSKTV